MKLKCDNCPREGEEAEFKSAKDILQRHEIGDRFSNLECPDCGALAFPLSESRQTAPTVPADIESMTLEQARSMAFESLLIRADQWREIADIDHVNLEELYEATTDERRKMHALYQKAHWMLYAAGDIDSL